MYTTCATERAVLSIVGINKLGTVAAVTAFLNEHHANIEACYGARMGSMFGLFLLFAARPGDMEDIVASHKDALRDYSPSLRPAKQMEKERGLGTAPFELTVFAYDDVGIVATIAKVLRGFKIDIVSVGSCQYAAPQCGTPLLVVEMKLDVPAAMAMKPFRTALWELQESRNWDIDFRPERPAQLMVPSMPFPPSSAAGFTDRIGEPVLEELSLN